MRHDQRSAHIAPEDGNFLVCYGLTPVATFKRYPEAYTMASRLSASKPGAVRIITVSNARTLLSL